MHACVLAFRSRQPTKVTIKVSNPGVFYFGVESTQPKATHSTFFQIKSQQL
jgi:hypothetical protein